jgi:hypothetical protein
MHCSSLLLRAMPGSLASGELRNALEAMGAAQGGHLTLVCVGDAEGPAGRSCRSARPRHSSFIALLASGRCFLLLCCHSFDTLQRGSGVFQRAVPGSWEFLPARGTVVAVPFLTPSTYLKNRMFKDWSFKPPAGPPDASSDGEHAWRNALPAPGKIRVGIPGALPEQRCPNATSLASEPGETGTLISRPN